MTNRHTGYATSKLHLEGYKLDPAFPSTPFRFQNRAHLEGLVFPRTNTLADNSVRRNDEEGLPHQPPPLSRPPGERLGLFLSTLDPRPSPGLPLDALLEVHRIPWRDAGRQGAITVPPPPSWPFSGLLGPFSRPPTRVVSWPHPSMPSSSHIIGYELGLLNGRTQL